MNSKRPMRIGAFYPLIAGVLLALLVLFAVLGWFLYSASTDYIELQERHARIESISDELRQSSDDLTRYARLYAVTGDQKYFDIFNAVIAIRKGEMPRPKNYQDIYWDLHPEAREERHPPEEPRKLSDAFAELMTPEEIIIIEESRQQSNILARTLESDAFGKIKAGELNDAVELLHSEEYRKQKHDIMLPLDKLAEQIRERLQKESEEYRKRIDSVFLVLIITLFVGGGVMQLVISHSRQRILRPLDRLARGILENKDTDNDTTGFHNDEIGLLARHFFQMKSSMERNYRELENASFRDGLTGVYNRNYFFQQGELAFKRTLRDKQKLCVMMADLDHFKSINDSHGHLSGDDALKHATKMIIGNIRETDIAARFGGEEFIVILIRTQLSDAVAVAEKIRTGMEKTPCESNGEEIPVTISIGVTEINDDDKDISAAIARADKALYSAKEAGRNCTKTSA